MKLSVPVRAPFSFAHALAFLRRFPPCRGEYLIADDAITAAVAIDGRAVPFTIRGATVETPAHGDAIVARAAHFLGTEDDLTAFYAAAAGDPPFAPVIDALHGLHHVRFLTLGEIAVYAVMMQRASIERAAALKRRFLARFGVAVAGEPRLRAWPELPALCELTPRAIAGAIGHRPKAEQIANAVRGVAAIGEPFLRDAPYAEARDRLLAIPGIGPFSAAAILLRGLGRMDELPWLDIFDREARSVYGEAVDPAEIQQRYGNQIGYWSFYLRITGSRTPAASARSPRSRGAGTRTAPRPSRGTSRGPSSSRTSSRPA